MVYLADYYLTIYTGKLFRGPLKEHIAFEGSLELTPVFQNDIDALRLVSRTFLVRWLLSLILIYLVWLLCTLWFPLYFLFDFLMGGLLLREAAVLLRHSRNIGLALLNRRRNGIEGKIIYARWLSLGLSAVDLAGFGFFYLALAVGLQSAFFLGGGIICVLTGLQHWSYARKRY